jgi:hypothetical protein
MVSFAEQMAQAQIVVREDMNRVMRHAIEEAGRRLIERSPVDTGRFRSNWRYGLTTPDLFANKVTNEWFVHNLDEMPKDLLGFRHFITNALPYGPALERGSSAQAPQGFAGLTAVEWPNIVSFSVGKVGRSVTQGGAL